MRSYYVLLDTLVFLPFNSAYFRIVFAVFNRNIFMNGCIEIVELFIPGNGTDILCHCLHCRSVAIQRRCK